MSKIVIKGPEDTQNLPHLLEGYLYGLGELCHRLFGPEGEANVYEAIGKIFVRYMREKRKIDFTESDPWERYCHIIRVFTEHGFYSHVEMEKRGDNEFWMLESGQYAGDVWEDMNAWERGTPPCPLWATILYSLSEIGYTIILDKVCYRPECDGYESTFHFEKLEDSAEDAIERARKAIGNSLIPVCAGCEKVRDSGGDWNNAEEDYLENNKNRLTHSICPDCRQRLYPDMDKK